MIGDSLAAQARKHPEQGRQMRDRSRGDGNCTPPTRSALQFRLRADGARQIERPLRKVMGYEDIGPAARSTEAQAPLVIRRSLCGGGSQGTTESQLTPARTRYAQRDSLVLSGAGNRCVPTVC